MSNEPPESSGFNPYGPTAHDAVIGDTGPISLPPGMQPGMVGQVQIVGVLMIVQGALDSLMAIGIAIYAFAMPMVFEEMQRDAAARGGPATPLPPNAGFGMMVGGTVFALLIAAVGIATVVAGVRLLRFRGRVFGITMLCAGMMTLFTCYCFPTSVALAIYGLIVLLSSPVRLAFDLRSQEHDVASIQTAFLSLR